MVLPDPFAAELTARRRARLRELLAARHDGAAFVASDPVNIRYLCGFAGSAGALLLDGETAVLFTDSRYLLLAADQAPGVEIRKAGDALDAAVQAAVGERLLLEGHHLPAARWVAMSGADGRLALAADLVAGLRTIKDDAEVAVLEHACALSGAALRQVLAEGALGRSEREIARRLEWLLGEAEGEGPGFPSIVAAGPNSAVPHHQPSARTVQRGDLLKIDFGARVRGYHADITRTFIVASDGEPWQRDIHRVVADAQRAGRAAAVAGVRIAEVDAAARGIIERGGHAEHFGHGLGHGVGLAIHERPLIWSAADGTLASGMAITIEPGVYLPGRGGVRIEDTVLVGPQACRCLVELDRDLVTVE